MKRNQTGIALGAKDRSELERIAADGNERQKIVKRARIVLLTARGHGVMAIMRAVGVSKTTVWRWQDYFVEAGVAGLVKGRSKPPGRKPIPDDLKLKIVEKTVKERPPAATHWSVRTMAVLAQNPIRLRNRFADEDFGRRFSIVQAEWCLLLRSEHHARVRDWQSEAIADRDDAPRRSGCAGSVTGRQRCRPFHRSAACTIAMSVEQRELTRPIQPPSAR